MVVMRSSERGFRKQGEVYRDPGALLIHLPENPILVVYLGVN